MTRGRGIVTTIDGETEVKTGDAVYFAGNELHGFKNSGTLFI